MFLDVRYACRLLARNPGFAAVAIVTLALGIGATTAMFSFVDAVVLRPLALANAGRLVLVTPAPRTSGPSRVSAVADGDFLDWQSRNRVFDSMTAMSTATYSMTSGGEPERVAGAAVTRGFFDTIGVSAIAGRSFSASDRRDVAPDPAVIGAGLWRRRFNADPTVVGKPLVLNGKPYTLIGIMPPGFTFPGDLFLANDVHLQQPIELWVAYEPTPEYRNNARSQVVARLKPHVTLPQAQADLSNIARAIAQDVQPNRQLALDVRLVPLGDWIGRAGKPLLFMLLGTVGFLLVIACSNVANLLLGRAIGRQREIAVRAALGSSRWRLIRHLITESVLLSTIGGAAGLLVAAWAIELAAALIPPGTLPRIGEVDLNRDVLAFALAASTVSGLLFGLAPALHVSKPDIIDALKSAGLAQTFRSRMFSALVIAEVALSFVLLAGAGLLLKSFVRLTSVDPGFTPAGVLTASVTLPEGNYPGPIEIRQFVRAALERIHSVPGVVHAGVVNWLPFGGNLLSGDFLVEDVPQLPRDLVVAKPAVSADYFQAMGIPLESGRPFSDADNDRTAPVALVSESLARRVWPGQSAIGKRIKVGIGRPADQPWTSVVGVVADIKQTALGRETRPALYVPWEQAGRGADKADRSGLNPATVLLRNVTFVMRTATGPMSVAAAVRQEIRRVDPMLPFDRIQTMRQWIDDSVSEPRFRSLVLASFAGLALALVGIGMLGVIGHAVSRRTREIGIRMTLGAQRVDVLRLVVREAVVVTGVGIAAGAAGAAALTRLLTSFLFEVEPLDLSAFAAAAAALVAVAAIASYVPARRASRVDPVVTLRSE